MRLIFAVTAILAAMLMAVPASAQVLTVRQVVSDCPDIDRAQACPGLAERFVSSRPAGPQRDAQIVNLVLAIAEAAQQPRVPMPACLNAADGLRVLAGGVSNAGQAQQIRDIADALCEGIQTAAIGEPGNPGGGGGGGGFPPTPQSLVGAATPSPVLGPPPGCTENCDGDTPVLTCDAGYSLQGDSCVADGGGGGGGGTCWNVSANKAMPETSHTHSSSQACLDSGGAKEWRPNS